MSANLQIAQRNNDLLTDAALISSMDFMCIRSMTFAVASRSQIIVNENELLVAQSRSSIRQMLQCSKTDDERLRACLEHMHQEELAAASPGSFAFQPIFARTRHGVILAVKQLPIYDGASIRRLTTEDSDDKKERGREAGAKAWIVKPFLPPQLLNVVSKLVMP